MVAFGVGARHTSLAPVWEEGMVCHTYLLSQHHCTSTPGGPIQVTATTDDLAIRPSDNRFLLLLSWHYEFLFILMKLYLLPDCVLAAL